MPDTPDRGEQAADPAAGHGRTLAELVEEQAQAQRDRTAAVFGFNPDQAQDEEHNE